MSERTTVPASEFARNFGRYRDEALAGSIIAVTSHGRMVGAFLSTREPEHYERLKRREREVLVTGGLPDEVEAEIEAAEHGAGPR